MFKRLSNGWQIGAAAALLLACMSPAWCQDNAIKGNPAAAPAAAPQQFKVEVAPDATPKPEGVGSERIQVTFGESEKDLLTRAAVEKLNAPIESLEFSNADLRNVIRIIGERLNINFIFDAGDITGNITLRLRNVRLRDAMDSILKTRKLAIIVDPSGIFRIVPQEQINRSAIETRTEVIQLNWIPAEEVAKTMKPFLSSEKEGRLVPNKEANTIIVTDVPPQIEVIRKLIEKIDTPQREVMIEARLIDINIGALHDLSTDLSISKLNGDYQSGPVDHTLTKTITNTDGVISSVIEDKFTNSSLSAADTLGVVNNILDGISVKGGTGSLALGDTINVLGTKYNLNAVFTALETRNVIQVLANPNVRTLNNLPATIDITQKIPYTEANNDAGGQTTQKIQFQDAGVKILVTPTVTSTGYVRMGIQLSQKLDRGRAATASSELPLPAHIIDERNATTNVIVSSGETAVLGGLRQLNAADRVDGVPWLHRIPLLGWLFKNKSNEQAKTDLLLMMTPTIVTSNKKLTEKEQKYYDLIDKEWNKPDYMMDDVSNEADLNKAKDK